MATFHFTATWQTDLGMYMLQDDDFFPDPLYSNDGTIWATELGVVADDDTFDDTCVSFDGGPKDGNKE